MCASFATLNVSWLHVTFEQLLTPPSVLLYPDRRDAHERCGPTCVKEMLGLRHASFQRGNDRPLIPV